LERDCGEPLGLILASELPERLVVLVLTVVDDLDGTRSGGLSIMGFMLRLPLVAAVTTVAVLFAWTALAQAGVTHSPTARGGAGTVAGASLAATASLGPTLYDQNDNDGGDGFTSTSYSGTQAADDFVVPATESWHVTSVFVPGSGFADLSSVTVTIYGDSSGGPGAQVYTVNVPSGSFTDDLGLFNFPGGNLTIPIDATLPSGHYWLSVQGDGSYWFWEIRGVVSNHPAMWENPDGLFGTGCTSWGDMATCFAALGTPYPPNSLDLMFTLGGTSTPVGPPYTGTPGRTNCVGTTVSALSNAYGGDLSAAARALGFASVKALMQDIKQYCAK